MPETWYLFNGPMSKRKREMRGQTGEGAAMTNPPRTLEQARRYWYGTDGNLRFHRPWCAYKISVGHFQCSRAPGHGPAKLYCKQHAKMLERGRG